MSRPWNQGENPSLAHLFLVSPVVLVRRRQPLASTNTVAVDLLPSRAGARARLRRRGSGRRIRAITAFIGHFGRVSSAGSRWRRGFAARGRSDGRVKQGRHWKTAVRQADPLAAHPDEPRLEPMQRRAWFEYIPHPPWERRASSPTRFKEQICTSFPAVYFHDKLLLNTTLQVSATKFLQ